MRFERMKQRIRALEEVAAWPQMVDLIDRAVHQESRSVWEFPLATCRAVGGSSDAALLGAAAVFCSLTSIHLVDDMLDEDPRGDYRQLGSGQTANLALAFQAAAHRLLGEASERPETLAALHANLSRMALATAFGQALDARPLDGEPGYWQAVDAKTPPLFGTAFAVGALLGGAPAAVVAELERLGGLVGRFVQVSDDLADAIATPAGADWRRPGSNLPILYALTADHAERERFRDLLPRVEDPDALAAAQRVLFGCGAVGYCLFKLLAFSREAGLVLSQIPLRDPTPVERLLASQVEPLERLLAKVGVETPAELALP